VLDQTRCTARLRFRPVFRFSQVGGGGAITMLTMQVLLIISAKGLSSSRHVDRQKEKHGQGQASAL
jgi:hypothetical protein